MSLRLPTIEWHKVKDLIPWDQNPRVHDAEQLRLLVKSIRHHGMASLIVIQKNTRRILAGHGRHEALMDMGEGETPIPCVVVECSLEDAEALTVADNRLGDLSDWSLPALRDVMGELDVKRRSGFLPLLESARRTSGQVFMTCTEENWPSELGGDLHRWEVASGALKRNPLNC